MLKPIKNSVDALYVHIPFCSHICHYCDFTKMLYDRARIKPYVDALIVEVTTNVAKPVQTIFIGGGTPSTLTAEEIEPLLKTLSSRLARDGEFTVECNVESTTEEKLKLYQRYGVNRLSFGVQSFQPSYLEWMNRFHNRQQITDVIALAKKIGFTDINVDLIYDLKGQTDAELNSDLRAFIALDIDHISTYALTIHPNTVFGIQRVKPASDETSRRHYIAILNALRKAGYERYEVSNFARHGKRSRHNQTYWKNDYYYGCGLGASGYEPGLRYTNTKNINDYIAGRTRKEFDPVTDESFETDYVMLQLRMADGIILENFQKTFSQTFHERYRTKLPFLIDKKLIELDSRSARLTDEGFLLLDYVVLKLLR